MAEIKSTMELVMERAARMGKASEEEIEREELRREGMRLAAGFLDKGGDSPAQLLAGQDPARQEGIRQGMADVLLRNIFLPRDDQGEQRSRQAAQALIELAGGAGDIGSICQEMLHIGAQYQQHRKQLKDQLEGQVRMQLEQALAQQMGGRDTEGLDLEPTVQAKIREEWARVEAELDSQYNQALDQHRDLLRQRLGLDR